MEENNIISMSDFYEKLQGFSNSWFNNDEWKGEAVRDCEPYRTGDIIDVRLRDSLKPASWLSQADHLGVDTFELIISDQDHCRANVQYRILVQGADFLGNVMSLQEIAFKNLNRFLMTKGYGCLKKEVVKKLKKVASQGPE